MISKLFGASREATALVAEKLVADVEPQSIWVGLNSRGSVWFRGTQVRIRDNRGLPVHDFELLVDARRVQAISVVRAGLEDANGITYTLFLGYSSGPWLHDNEASLFRFDLESGRVVRGMFARNLVWSPDATCCVIVERERLTRQKFIPEHMQFAEVPELLPLQPTPTSSWPEVVRLAENGSCIFNDDRGTWFWDGETGKAKLQTSSRTWTPFDPIEIATWDFELVSADLFKTTSDRRFCVVRFDRKRFCFVYKEYEVAWASQNLVARSLNALARTMVESEDLLSTTSVLLPEDRLRVVLSGFREWHIRSICGRFGETS
jgi:hypothetical protein